jgi:hypothetical protein
MVLLRPVFFVFLVISMPVAGATNDFDRNHGESNWQQVAEGVFESTDECGKRHLRMVGEEGIRWQISQLESDLDSLRGSDGLVPHDRVGIADAISTRLMGLYKLVELDDAESTREPSCTGTADLNEGSGSCGVQNYTYHAYACGKHSEYGVSTPYGYATASLTSCSGGWAAKAEAYTYRDSGVEESHYDPGDWSQTPQASSSLTPKSSATCGYAWSRVTVCYNCEEAEGIEGLERSYYVYEAEDDYPDSCY